MLATLRDLKMSGGGKQNTGQSERKNKGKQTYLFIAYLSSSFYAWAIAVVSATGQTSVAGLARTGFRLRFWLISMFSGASDFSVVVLGSVGGKSSGDG